MSKASEVRDRIRHKKKRHDRHREWIDKAHDWEGMSREKQEKWLCSKLSSYHDPKGWLLAGAEKEDAKNIGALVLRISSDRLCRRLARALVQG